jgi:hypothetical protein
MRACRNATHALDAPGGKIVSGWQGQSGVHDRSKARASRGIKSWGDGEASGKVTARGGVGGVGGVLTKHRVLGSNGDVQGAGGVAHPVAVAWGCAGWSAGAAHAHWGLAGGGGVEGNRGRGFGRAMPSGSSFSLVSN